MDSKSQNEKVAEYLEVLGNYEDKSSARDQAAYHEYYEQAGYAKDALKEMGRDIIDDLIPHLNSPNPKIRHHVVALLGMTRDDSVLYPLQRQLSYETDPEIKKRIEYWIKKLKEPDVKQAPKPQPKKKPEVGLFGRLSKKLDSLVDGKKPQPDADNKHVRRCFICNKKIEAGDNMFTQHGLMLRSSGTKSQVQEPVFCSRNHQMIFKKNPASYR